MEKRTSKQIDRKDIEKAFRLLKEVVHLHPEIGRDLWVSAYWSILVEAYSSSGVSYEKFSQQWDNLKVIYRHWWDDQT